MFEFFDKIIGFFDMVWEMVINFVNSLIMILGTVLQIPVVVATLAVALPSIIFTGLTVTISFAIIKFILGR